MPHFVYILQSEIDSTFYIGSTADLQKRLSDHNAGLSRYTAAKRPWKIAYSEAFETKREALKREIFLKKMKNREFYQRLIDGSSVG